MIGSASASACDCDQPQAVWHSNQALTRLCREAKGSLGLYTEGPELWGPFRNFYPRGAPEIAVNNPEFTVQVV